jgi:nitrogen fixation NifU-like protein
VGNYLKVYFKLDGFVVEDVKFKLQGCVPAVAFMSVLTEKLKGKDLRSALQEISKEEIINELSGIPENKLFCPIIGLSVIELALQKLSSEK